jgi:hypothetical protein
MVRSIVGFGNHNCRLSEAEAKGKSNSNERKISSQMDRKKCGFFRSFCFYCSDNDRDARLILYRQPLSDETRHDP